MLILQDITSIHPDKTVLFENISLAINQHDKIALVGNNGVGKSTLMKIMAGAIQPSAGIVKTPTKPYYIPQLAGQNNQLSLAQAFQITDKLKALREILDGQVTDANLALLNDDWSIEERCYEALNHWGLDRGDLMQPLQKLSGGEKTKVYLAGIFIHQPDLILMDEPTNHLDTEARQLLYHFVQSTSSTLCIVSHDKTLLNLLEAVYEMNKRGIKLYGGNYDFYANQKLAEQEALYQDLKSGEKTLRKAKEKKRETLERQQKLDARGKKKQEKAGLPTIVMNTLKNNAEQSTARIKGAHEAKITEIARGLQDLRATLPNTDKMKMGLDSSSMHKGKVLFRATNVNCHFNDQWLWPDALNFQIASGERIALKGLNGSGKTTLIKIILGQLNPHAGDIYRADCKSVYIDQDYSLVSDPGSVYDLAQKFNTSFLAEHEIKIRLNRVLFTRDDWNKPSWALSGGEKLRLMLCCLTLGHQPPDLIVLDEPTNNLDIQNTTIMTAAVNEYQGTLLVVSHDSHFLAQTNMERTINLSRNTPA